MAQIDPHTYEPETGAPCCMCGEPCDRRFRFRGSKNVHRVCSAECMRAKTRQGDTTPTPEPEKTGQQTLF